MKKLSIFAILSTVLLLFINCGPKEKQETTKTPNDTIVTETVVIDTVSKSKVVKKI